MAYRESIWKGGMYYKGFKWSIKSNKKLNRCCALLYDRYTPRQLKVLVSYISEREDKWFSSWSDQRVPDILYGTGFYKLILPVLNKPMDAMPLLINERSVRGAVAAWRLAVGR